MLQVHLTSHCLRQLEGLQGPLTWPSPESDFSQLLASLGSSVIPNLARFPDIGQPYLAQPPQSAEALAMLAKLPAGSPLQLRRYDHGKVTLLYCLQEEAIHLLSIRDHQMREFDLLEHWQSTTAAPDFQAQP